MRRVAADGRWPVLDWLPGRSPARAAVAGGPAGGRAVQRAAGLTHQRLDVAWRNALRPQVLHLTKVTAGRARALRPDDN